MSESNFPHNMTTEGSSTEPGAPQAEDWASWGLTQSNKVILVADLVESVRMMEADEALAVRRWRAFMQQVTGHILPTHAGRLVKSLGDGLMAEFDDARAANLAAQALHKAASAVQERLPSPDPDQFFALRIGAHAAKVFADEHDIYGAGVNLAARVAALAQPGETVVTSEVRDGLTDGLDSDQYDLGLSYLKHVATPVRAWRIAPVHAQPALQPVSDPLTTSHARVAVVGFLCNEHNWVFAELLADWLSQALSRQQGIVSIHRQSAREVGARTLGATENDPLQCKYRVQGQLLQVGATLLLNWTLIEQAGGRVHASGHTEFARAAPAAALGAPISEVAEAITTALMLNYSQVALSAELPTIPSYGLLLGAIGLMHRQSPAPFQKSFGLIQHLNERHPRSALAKTWLAKWHVLHVAQGWAGNVAASADQALRASERACELAPHHALGFAMLGHVRAYLSHDLVAAREHLDTAVALDPQEPLAWLYRSAIHAYQERGEEAVEEAARARSLSPLDPLRYYFDNFALTASLCAGDHESAVVHGERSLRRNRTHAPTLRLLAVAQVQGGNVLRARQLIEEMRRLSPEFTLSQFRARHPARGATFFPGFVEALRQAGLAEA